MKYVKQFAVIMLVTALGELLKFLIPLPIPGSIYGLILMLAGLMTGIIKLENVERAGEFLVEIMPVMFIPAAVGLLDSWSELQSVLLPVCVIIVVVCFLVFGATGKVTDILLARKAPADSTDKEEKQS